MIEVNYNPKGIPVCFKNADTGKKETLYTQSFTVGLLSSFSEIQERAERLQKKGLATKPNDVNQMITVLMDGLSLLFGSEAHKAYTEKMSLEALIALTQQIANTNAQIANSQTFIQKKRSM